MFDYLNKNLPLKDRIQDLLNRLTLDEKIKFLSTSQPEIERLSIREFHIGTEIARGLVNRDPEKPSTVFPQPVGMSASFDKAMMLEIGRTASREARAYYNQSDKTSGLMMWGPTVDLCRNPLWGRTEESYGEDPFLTGEMASMYTLGLRGNDPEIWAVIPTLKHFCANNHEQERISDNANLNPRLKHEYYYKAFKKPVVKGGAHSIMTAYNEIYHAPAVVNPDLKTILKKQWGLGFIVTDAGDFAQNLTDHHAFHSHAESLKACLSAGMDCVTDHEDCVMTATHKALETGLISESEIDEAVSNILESHFLLGRFDETTPYDNLTLEDVNTPEDRALNLRAARENIILLNNDKNILPLNAEKIKKIGLFGCNADVNLKDWYTGYASYHISVRKALEEKGFQVVYDAGWQIIKLLAPNQKFIRVGEDDFLYADADENSASEFYFCQHDTSQNWTNFQEIKSGRFLCLEHDFIKLGKQEVYGWFTHETFRLTYHSRKKGQIISDYLFGNFFSLNQKNQVICQEEIRPTEKNMFQVYVTSFGNERMKQLSKDCDAVVYCGGNDPMQVARECYDRKSLYLPTLQNVHLALLKHYLEESSVPLIFLIISSYPYALYENHTDDEGNPIPSIPDAILWSSHAGSELGHAVADVLFGAYNPAGRCPLTWYACDEDLPDIKNYDIIQTKSTYQYFDGEPLYPFGYGLSYSKFEYTDLKIQVLEKHIQVNCNIKNISERDGEEVIQIYFHAESQRIPRPEIQLCAFERILIKSGETIHFSVSIPLEEFEFYDVSREKFCLESGDYKIMIGASSKDIRLSEIIHLNGEIIPPRMIKNFTRAELYDSQCHTEIFMNPLTGITHVKGLKWHNHLIFLNCDFTGCQAFTVKASSPAENSKIYLCIDFQESSIMEIPVPVSDGFEDFKSCTIALTLSGCHHVQLAFGQNLCIQGFQIQH